MSIIFFLERFVLVFGSLSIFIKSTIIYYYYYLLLNIIPLLFASSFNSFNDRFNILMLWVKKIFFLIAG